MPEKTSVWDGSQWWHTPGGDHSPGPDTNWTTLLNVDYGLVGTGTMTGAKMGALFPGETFSNTYSGYARMVMVDDAERGRVMRVDFSNGGANGGSPDEAIQIFPQIHFESYPGGFAEAKDRAVKMTDWMKYPSTFILPAAAKVCGLGGNVDGASNGAASGGNGKGASMINALSCRIMEYSAPGGNWSSGIPGFTSDLIGRNNRFAMYTYLYGMSKNGVAQDFGLDLWDPDPGPPGHWPSTLTGSGTSQRALGDGLWHKRTLLMSPNTQVGGVWQADGKLRFYLDGVLIHHYDNMKWRSNSDLWVNKYWLHHFLGGAAAGYGSPQAQSYYYDGPIVEFANYDGWTD